MRGRSAGVGLVSALVGGPRVATTGRRPPSAPTDSPEGLRVGGAMLILARCEGLAGWYPPKSAAHGRGRGRRATGARRAAGARRATGARRVLELWKRPSVSLSPSRTLRVARRSCSVVACLTRLAAFLDTGLLRAVGRSSLEAVQLCRMCAASGGVQLAVPPGGRAPQDNYMKRRLRS